MASTININGKRFSGNNVVMTDNIIYIDGKKIEDVDILEAKTVNITIEGNLDNLEVDCCETIIVKGDVNGDVKTSQGSIEIDGNVKGDVKTSQGSIRCGNVGGNVKTSQGSIRHT